VHEPVEVILLPLLVIDQAALVHLGVKQGKNSNLSHREKEVMCKKADEQFVAGACMVVHVISRADPNSD